MREKFYYKGEVLSFCKHFVCTDRRIEVLAAC